MVFGLKMVYKLLVNAKSTTWDSQWQKMRFNRFKIQLDDFFEIVITSFFWTGPPVSEKADTKYHYLGGISFEILTLLLYIRMTKNLFDPSAQSAKSFWKTTVVCEIMIHWQELKQLYHQCVLTHLFMYYYLSIYLVNWLIFNNFCSDWGQSHQLWEDSECHYRKRLFQVCPRMEVGRWHGYHFWNLHR